MGYDNVMLRIGNFGPYQRRIFLILSLPAISWAFQKMGGVFLAAKPNFRCLLPHESPENATYQLPSNITNITHPWDNKIENWPQCESYDPDLADSFNSSRENFPSTFSTVKCDSFVYDKTQYTRTVTTEWDLVCENAWLKVLSDSLFMLGDVPGGIIFGGLSDRYGRKKALLLGLTIQFICGVLVAVSPEFITFTISRVLVGTTVSGVFLVAYVFAIEMVGPKNRMVAGAGINLSYITGYILIAGLAYFIPNWRKLQIVFIVPSFAFLVFSRYVPESARWLLTKGRVKEARDILHEASVQNGKELSRNTIDSLSEDKIESQPIHEQISMFDILKYPNLRKRSLLLFSIWFALSLTYYGLSWNTSNLGGNDYLNFVIAAAVEIPAQGFVLLTINKLGRRIILCGSMCFSGISLILTFFVPTGMSWLTILLAMMGKSTITVTYATVYVFTSEQYPTAIRNVSVGACSAFARLGGVVAPYINFLFEISTYLPLVVLGSSSLVFGLLSLLLPETLNQKLPESIEEGEKFGKITKEIVQDIEQSNDVAMEKLMKK